MPPVLFPLASALSPLGAARGGAARVPQSRYSVALDGTGYVNVPGPFSAVSGVSVAFWRKVSSWAVSAQQTYLCVGPQQAGVGYHWGYLNQSSAFSIAWQYATPSDRNTATSAPFAGAILGTWRHVAVTHQYAPNVVSFYVDGVLLDQQSPGDAVVPVTGKAATLGTYINGSTFPSVGNLDDELIYPGVLTAAQIAALAAGTLDPATLVTSGLWRFEEGSGAAAADSSGNGNDGTLTGGVTWSSDVAAQLQ